MPSLSADARRVSANSMNNWKTDGPSVDVVTTSCGSGESTGDGSRRLPLVRTGRESLRDNQIRLLPDWGSSGRRFKSCQPDTVKKPFRTKLWSLIGPRTPTRTPTEFCTSRAFSGTC
jgi:hypothetical protein